MKMKINIQLQKKKQKTKSIKTNKRRKKFQEIWLRDPRFKDWVLPVKENPCKAFCKVCKTNIVCGASELNKHLEGKNHKINFDSMKQTPSIRSYIDTTNQKQKIKYAEMKLTSFFAEHNVSLHVIDHLTPLLKKIAPDSKIMNEIHLGRTKMTNVLTQVLAKVEDEELTTIIQRNNFSIFIDESTDISNMKNICVLVRYIVDFEVKTQLLELVNIDAVDCSAVKIFQQIKLCFQKRNINIQNIIAMASDNAAVMIGDNNSVYTMLQQDIGSHHELILLKCICHSSALVLKSAIRKIPENIETFLRNCASYMSESPKSCAVLKEFQEYFEIAQRKISSPAATRWLSMHPCIIKILENWAVLKHFFVYDSSVTKRKKAEIILNEFENVETKAYLLFLKNILNYFNRFNALFQSETVLVHKLYEESKNLLLIMGRFILKPETIQLITSEVTLNFHLLVNDDTRIQLKEIEFDSELTEYLKENLDERQETEVKSNCRRFLEVAIEKILTKFPVNSDFFKSVEFINPDLALNATKRKFSKKLTHISSYVECDKFQLEDEWRDIPFQFSEKEKENLILLGVEEFWKTMASKKALNGDKLYPNLIKVVNFTLTLPHSNADAERIFSMVTDIKSKKRNRLGEETLNSLCVFKSALKKADKTCLDFEPNDSHYALFKSEKLYPS